MLVLGTVAAVIGIGWLKEVKRTQDESCATKYEYPGYGRFSWGPVETSNRGKSGAWGLTAGGYYKL
jgi:hypothetical protein